MMRSCTISLYQPLVTGSGSLAMPGYDLMAVASGWRRSSANIGGYQSGSFSIGEDALTRNELSDLYDRLLGCRLLERTFSIDSWEGEITEVELTLDGVTHRRSLDPATWHNRVRVDYSTIDAASGIGSRATLTWASNADSQAQFGDCQFLYSLDGRTAAGAAAFQADKLARNAWPVSRQVDSVVVGGGTERKNGLAFIMSGYWATANRRYYEANIASTNASTVINTLVAATQFLLPGCVETNTMQTGVQAERNPERIGNLLAAKTSEGDGTNSWRIGVYAGRCVDYEPIPTTVDFFYERGMLVDKTHSPVILSLVRPGFYLHNASAPFGNVPPGATGVRNDPRNAYVQRVEFDADAGSISLYFDNEDRPLTVYQPMEE